LVAWNSRRVAGAGFVPGSDGFGIFLLRQFFAAIPRELYESATIDGASIPRIIWSVYLPLSRPALVSAGVMFFISQWQAHLWPLMVAPSQDSQLANVRLALLWQPFDPRWGEVLAAGSILFLVPAVVVFAMQRYFVQSLATSGIAG
jgi:putative chitobiose transport system permease protein